MNSLSSEFAFGFYDKLEELAYGPTLVPHNCFWALGRLSSQVSDCTRQQKMIVACHTYVGKCNKNTTCIYLDALNILHVFNLVVKTCVFTTKFYCHLNFFFAIGAQILQGPPKLRKPRRCASWSVHGLPLSFAFETKAKLLCSSYCLMQSSISNRAQGGGGGGGEAHCLKDTWPNNMAK